MVCRRWARDLHDDTLQELAGVQVLLGTAAASHDPAVQAAAITDARDAVGRQIQALRRLISRMRPLALDTLGLDAALEDLARNAAEASSIDIQVHTADLPRLPADTETAVYRIVQEALTNAVRHASARRITIEAQAAGRALAIIVRDDGTRRTPTTGPFSGSPLNTCPTHSSQKDFGKPSSGRQVRIFSAPSSSSNPPAATIPPSVNGADDTLAALTPPHCGQCRERCRRGSRGACGSMTQTHRNLLPASGRLDSNQRPFGPKPNALPDCATPRDDRF